MPRQQKILKSKLINSFDLKKINMMESFKFDWQLNSSTESEERNFCNTIAVNEFMVNNSDVCTKSKPHSKKHTIATTSTIIADSKGNLIFMLLILRTFCKI